MSVNVHLPLSLDSKRNFELFFNALNDRNVREGVTKQQETPDAIHELVALTNDPHFLSQARQLSKLYAAYLNGQTEAGDVRESGQQFREYLANKYPEATRLLQDYATMGRHNLEEGFTAANADVVANAEAVANAAAYVNVAAATNVVVAAEAIVFVAVFVI